MVNGIESGSFKKSTCRWFSLNLNRYEITVSKIELFSHWASHLQCILQAMPFWERLHEEQRFLLVLHEHLMSLKSLVGVGALSVMFGTTDSLFTL